jgi:regulator of protease activity HflC (stomatin/prohibitin superfamily)
MFYGPLLFVLFIILIGFRIVRPIEKGVVERFGKYTRTSEQGLRWVIPIVERMRKVNITEIRLDVEKQSVITKDNLNLEIDAVVYFKIQDSIKALYNVQDYASSIPSLAQTTLRSIIGEMVFTEVNANRQSINTRIEQELDSQTESWGIEVVRVELQDVNPAADVQRAMDQVVTAEREKEAAITRAVALKEAAKEEAEAAVIAAAGQKDAQIEIAIGEAEAIAKVNDSVEKTFKSKAQMFKQLEVTEASLAGNSKFVLTEKGITPTLVFNESDKKIIPVEA